ncbi:MAG: hypothetical protein ACI9MR_003961 [Myxococcota bacterium]|jgi:hypothetical protein
MAPDDLPVLDEVAGVKRLAAPQVLQRRLDGVSLDAL